MQLELEAFQENILLVGTALDGEIDVHIIDSVGIGKYIPSFSVGVETVQSIELF